MITLQPITINNFWETIDLQVFEYQQEFVTSNAVSMAQSKVQPECIPLAIYNDDILIGFLMYCIDTDDNEYWIYRLMIDKKFQQKGFGKATMNIIIDIIKKDKAHNKILLGVHKESDSAVKLYKNLGFNFNGQVFGKEHIMELIY